MSNTYTEHQTHYVLKGLGIEIKGGTYNDFTCLCPFHGNMYTPSMSVAKERGTFVCFNPSCNEKGTLLELVMRVSDRNRYEALRFINSKEEPEADPAEKLLAALEPEKEEIPEFPQHVIDRCAEALWHTPHALEYMHGRGFDDETLKDFNIGYSPPNKFRSYDVVTVPMHDFKGRPVGFIGRAIEEKRFKNSDELPTRKTWFNLHRAKRESQSVIITEASFDAMRVHQAGFPGVMANLSGNVNPTKLAWLDRYFTTIIIATDFDEKQYHDDKPKPGKKCQVCKRAGFPKCQGHNPGRDLGSTIADALSHKDIMWAVDSYQTVYPHGAKDMGDLTDDEIRHVIKNAVPNVEYIGWNVY